MKTPVKYFLFIALVLALGLVLASCTPKPTETVAEATPCPECPACPEPETCTDTAAPNQEEWAASAHADAAAEAFVHWNEEDPKEIPVYCAKCHSSTGFLDYIGADGSTAFQVDANSPIGTVITCDTCHNDVTAELSSVKFPSGAEVTGLGSEAVCMTCHQGSASMVQVDESITAAGLTDEDAVSDKLGFTNIHYYAAAVARYGKEVMGGYQYPGKPYDAMFDHVVGVQTCTDCHDSHSLELKVDTCVSCHEGVTTAEDARNIRFAASLVDYDGDGDTEEGIYYEVEGARETLYTAMQAYASEVAKAPLGYSQTAYPYFFMDTNADGVLDETEAVYPNAYKSWTPRLLKAAYNFQTSLKDPGAYAHGGKYILELLYDSTEDLNTKLATPVDLSMAVRADAGHFDGSAEAFRHWDEDGAVPGSCVKCHTGEGLPVFLKEGTNISMEPSNGLLCETCHSNLEDYARYEVELVTFPSGLKAGFEGDMDANLCLNCHQGQQSTTSVNRAISGKDPDTIIEKQSFLNVHYFAAGATLFGTDAKGVYEYPDKEYVGQFAHVPNYATCSDCHDAHALEVQQAACTACHSVDEPGQIRKNLTEDYDGDGDVTEGIQGEVEGLKTILYAALQVYAKDVLQSPIAYSTSAYPYFFIDTNANDSLDADEANYGNRYVSWSPRLLTAAYNYQYAQKDPGAYVHNGAYMLQVLYDSIEDLGGDVTTLVRP